MKDFSQTIMMGRLTADPETSYTKSGKYVCNFTLANNDEYKNVNGEKTEKVLFIKCIAWTKLGETIQQYCKKADKVQVVGRLTPRSWEDKDGTKRNIIELTVSDLQFLTPKGKSNKSPVPQGENQDAPAIDDGDVPF